MRDARFGHGDDVPFAIEALEARAMLSAAAPGDAEWDGHRPVADAEFLDIDADTSGSNPVDDCDQPGHADGGPRVLLGLNDLGGVWGSPGDAEGHQAPGSEVEMFTSDDADGFDWDAPIDTSEVRGPQVRPTMNDNTPTPRDPSAKVFTMPVVAPVLAIADAPASPGASAPLAEVVETPKATAAPTIAAPVAPASISWLEFSSVERKDASAIGMAPTFVGLHQTLASLHHEF